MCSSSIRNAFILNDCCCGCGLRKGSLYIAWFQLISAALLAIFSGLTLRYIQNDDTLNKESKDFEDTKLRCIVAVVYFAFVGVVQLLLLAGVHKNSPRLINIWVIITISDIIVSILGSIYDAGIESTPDVSLFRMASVAFEILLRSYFIAVVWNLSRQLQEERAAAKRNNVLEPSMIK